MKRKAESQIEAPGQDSFLDVVCNLVGILIVLVMLIAAQAKRGMVAAAQASQQTAAADPTKEAEVKAAEAAAVSIEQSIQELQGKIERQNFEVALHEEDRNKIQVLVDVAEGRLGEYRDQLSADEKQRYDLEQELVKSKAELAGMTTTQVSLTKAKPHVLEHLPTPMARTVFGTEIHFRLLGHRLAYVPWDEVIERMKTDARNHINKLRDNSRIELSLPETAGFGAHYILRKADVQVETRSGSSTRHTGVELEQIYLVDAEPNLGQPIAAALAPGSEFRSRIGSLKPQSTTITIWVYPDSFDDFRALKAELFKMGYLCAARPMPMGEPIAGSPSGSRSSAE